MLLTGGTMRIYWNPVTMTKMQETQFSYQNRFKTEKVFNSSTYGPGNFQIGTPDRHICWKLFSVKIIFGILETECTQGLNLVTIWKDDGKTMERRWKDDVVDRGSHDNLLESCHNDEHFKRHNFHIKRHRVFNSFTYLPGKFQIGKTDMVEILFSQNHIWYHRNRIYAYRPGNF